MVAEANMRTNKYGVRGLKGVQLKNGMVYFWTPPLSLQKARIFRFKTLGTDLNVAVAKARDWNAKLEAYRSTVNGTKAKLGIISPMTVGFLIREFEASPKFARYALRTQQEYSNMYRNVEVLRVVDGQLMFGEMKMCAATTQLAYTIYERLVVDHGHDSANKTVSVLQAAFRYARLKFSEITINPFSRLDKLTSPSRRQRWTDQQLDSFIKKAEELGYPSVGRCALMCVELVQRPGDILSLKWSAYPEAEKVWHIHQSKRGAVVRVPETKRLRGALGAVRRSVKERSTGEISDLFVCATVTGKKWHRRNFTKAARRVARSASIFCREPDHVRSPRFSRRRRIPQCTIFLAALHNMRHSKMDIESRKIEFHEQKQRSGLEYQVWPPARPA
jgi:integrase